MERTLSEIDTTGLCSILPALADSDERQLQHHTTISCA